MARRRLAELGVPPCLAARRAWGPGKARILSSRHARRDTDAATTVAPHAAAAAAMGPRRRLPEDASSFAAEDMAKTASG
jgi:hypothetical protein